MKSVRILAHHERDMYGVIAQLESEDGTRTLTVSPAGKVRDCMVLIARLCDLRGLYVTCVSTPETIARDLRGPARDMMRDRPERALLRLIDRVDLLHPRLVKARITSPRRPR